jgi:hypothetical protein
LGDTAKELLSLAGNIKFEEDESGRRDANEDEEDDNDNVEGWIDERTMMADIELEELDESVEPVHLLLTKVSLLAVIPDYLIKGYLSFSFEKLPSLSKTQPLLSSLNGSPLSRNSYFACG